MIPTTCLGCRALLLIRPKMSQIVHSSFKPSTSVSKAWFSCSSWLRQDVTPFSRDPSLPVTDTMDTDMALEPEPIRRPLPLMTSRKLSFKPTGVAPKQAWLETLGTVEDEKLGLVDLHPEIFASFPRVDVLWWNIFWQKMFRKVDYRFDRSRAEMPGGGRKPWTQKGTGRARHGSIRSPLWKGGGKAHGHRGPTSSFFMLSANDRLRGLKSALTTKYAQGDLHIVDSLDVPTDQPEYLELLIESRGWGLSVLFVDDSDIVPENIAIATDQIKPYNIMPVYGLNVYSILKHETLVLSLAALERLEERMLFHLHSQNHRETPFCKTITGV